MSERRANKIYDEVLKQIEKMVGNKTTYSSDLTRVGRRLFGSKYLGTFAKDKVPTLKRNQYCIANLDNSSEPGSHWIALGNKDGTQYFHDSFGRKGARLGFGKNQNMREAKDFDAEQKVSETNCGARCLAALYVLINWNENIFLEI